MNNPTPKQIKKARKDSGLSQLAAAKLIYYNRQATWADWESGRNKMHQSALELFLIKTNKDGGKTIV